MQGIATGEAVKPRKVVKRKHTGKSKPSVVYVNDSDLFPQSKGSGEYEESASSFTNNGIQSFVSCDSIPVVGQVEGDSQYLASSAPKENRKFSTFVASSHPR